MSCVSNFILNLEGYMKVIFPVASVWKNEIVGNHYKSPVLILFQSIQFIMSMQ